MSWKDLLAKQHEIVTLPWLGNRSMRSYDQTWTLEVPYPREYGWYTLIVDGRRLNTPVLSDPKPELLKYVIKGYLVGDRIVSDEAHIDPDLGKIINFSERVHLLGLGIDRFTRISAGRIYEDGPLVFRGLEMPLGPEDDVLKAYLDQVPSLADVKNVTPALDAAFRMESWQRIEAERRRKEIERIAREEEEKRQREERRQRLAKQLGDGAGRRQMAQVDFKQAAKAALAVGGAELLDVRHHVRKGEMVVRYRLIGRRFECVCNEQLGIIDAGICLRDEETGFSGDRMFTLESLPGVVIEADREGKLVVFRHV